MLNFAREFYNDIREKHAEYYKRMGALRNRIDDLPTASETRLALGELADIAYAIREMEKFLEDNAKEMRKLQKHCWRILCELYVQDCVANPSEALDKIRTAHCTATPNVSSAPKLPSFKRQPEEYKSLMRWLGIPEASYLSSVPGEEDTDDICELVRPHWPGLQRFVTWKMAIGEALPDGLKMEELFKTYDVRITKRKEVSE